MPETAAVQNKTKKDIPDLTGQLPWELATDPASKVTLLVSSCDLFYDIWVPNFCLMRKFWPDCPFPVKLLTNNISIDEGPIGNIRLGPDRGWSNNLIAALDHVTTPYVMYFQEDHFLMRPVHTDTVLRCLRLLEHTGAEFFMFRAGGPEKGEMFTLHGLTFLRGPSPTLDTSNPDWGDSYSLHCDPSIWRVDKLRAILRPEESAWDFLRDAIPRAHAAGYRYYQFHWNRKKSAHIPIYYMKRSGVRLSMWHPEGLWLMLKNRVPLWPLRRPVLPFSTKAKRWVRGKPTLQKLVKWWLERVKAMSARVRRRVEHRAASVTHIPLNALVARWARRRGL